MMDNAKRHLQGHIAYFGVSGNSRSQRRSVNWARFGEVLKAWLPPVRILHNLYPSPLWMTQAGSRMV